MVNQDLSVSMKVTLNSKQGIMVKCNLFLKKAEIQGFSQLSQLG